MNRILAVLIGVAAMLALAFGLLRWLNQESAAAAGAGSTASAPPAAAPAPASGSPAAPVASGSSDTTPKPAPAPARRGLAELANAGGKKAAAAAEGDEEPEAPAGPPVGTVETKESGFRDPLFVASSADLKKSVDLSPAALDAVVATVNGKEIRERDLQDEIVLRLGDGAVEQVLMEWLLVSEMDARGWRPTDAEIDKAFDEYLKQNRIRDAKDAVEKTKFPESYLRFQAMLQTAFMKIMEQDQGGAGQVHPLFMQLWRDETMAKRRIDRLAITGFPSTISFRPELVVNPADNPGMLSKDEKRKRREERKRKKEAAAAGETVPDEPEDPSAWKPTLSVEPVDVKDKAAFEAFRRTPTPAVQADIVSEDAERVVVAMPFGTVAFRASEIGPTVRALPPGVLGRIDGREVTLEDVIPRVLPQVTPQLRQKIVEGLVESSMIRQELDRLGVKPDVARARDAFAKEEAEFQGSIISFEMYLQYDDSNPRLYFRDLLLQDGVHQIVGAEPSDATLREHFLANPVFFGHGAVRASHVLYSPFDEKTGKLKSETAWDDALARARKGADQLRQGLAFDQLVMKETDDKESRKYTEITREESQASGIVIQDPNDKRPKNVKSRVAGDLSYFPVKKGSQADSISAVAFSLKEGEWAGPVKSPVGWHLIRVTDVRLPRRLTFDPPPPPEEAPRPGEAPQPSPRQTTVYFDERLDEVKRDYLEDLRKEWTEKVRASSKIEVRS